MRHRDDRATEPVRAASPPTSRSSVRPAAFSVVLAVAACASSPDPELRSSHLGTEVAPPLGLDQLRVGMTADQARALVPDLVGEIGALRFGTGLANASLSIPLDSDGEIDGIELQVSTTRADMIEMLAAAWGDPLAKDGLGMPIWASADSGWRVDTTCWDSAVCMLYFDGYGAYPTGMRAREPSLPGPLAPLTGDMTIEEARAAVPGLPDATSGRGRHLGGGGLRYQIKRENGRFVRIDVAVPAPVRDAVVSMWPGGVVDIDGDHDEVTVWFDPVRRWRITLGPAHPVEVALSFERYAPVAALIGDGPSEAVPPVLAMVSDDPEDSVLVLPPTDWDRERSTALVFRDGRETTVALPLRYRSVEARDDLLAELARRWGPPVRDLCATGTELLFHPRSPRVVVTDEGDALLLFMSL